MSKPIVSIIIPVYNASAYLRDALSSVMRQTYDALDIIVIDDGSDDHSADVAEEVADGSKNVRILRRGHEGIVASLNSGLDVASGVFTARMDADDVAHPDRIASQVDFLDHNPDIDLCATWARLIHPRHRHRFTGAASYAAIRCGLLFRCEIVHPTVMARRRVFDEFRYRHEMEFAEDYDLWVRALRTYRMEIVPKVLLDYREHPAGVQVTHRELQEIRVRSIQRELLNEIGIDATDEQLELHRRLARWRFAHTRDELVAIERWLTSIREANGRTGIYDASAMNTELARWYYAVCSAIDTRTLDGIRAYRESSLADGHPVSLAQYARRRIKRLAQPLLRDRSGGPGAGV